MQMRIISGGELRKVAGEIIRNAVSASDSKVIMAVCVIGGDRISCCDEGIVFTDDPHRGIATIAPEGEFGSDGMPSIVGVFVRKDDRRQGYATTLFEEAIRRCVDRGFEEIHVDVMSRGMMQIVEKLPDELRGVLRVHDMTTLSIF